MRQGTASLARLDRADHQATPPPASADAGVRLEIAVVGEETPGLVVHGPFGRRDATRAAGCLVTPRPGDRVLVGLATENCYLLTVLERPDAAALEIAPAVGERLDIRARDVRIDGGESMTVTTPALAVETASARLVAGAATLLGRLVTLVGDRLRTTVRRQETTADHLAAKLGERITIVDGADVTEAAMSLTTIAGAMTTQVGSAVTTAKHDLRFDAERVSVG